MTQRVVLQDGVERADGQVTLDADDQTLLLGRGVFETLRTYGGVVFLVAEHMARLQASAAQLGVPFTDEDRLALELQTAADRIEGEAVVRVTLTHGGHRIVRATALEPALLSYRCAIRVWTPSDWLDGAVKHTGRANSVIAVETSEVDEVLWVDADGFLLEGTRSNIFGVIDGILCTPPLDGRQLAGVTRAAMLAAASSLGVPTSQCPMHRDDVFDELYLSSTLKELSPIGELDGAPAAGGGPVGERVSAAFRAGVSGDR